MERKIDYSRIYSPSKLRIFDLCPKQYHFHYLDPVYSRMKSDLKKLPHNIWGFQTLGKAVHNAITLFYHLPAKRRTEDSLKVCLKDTWRSEVMWPKKPPLGEWGGFESLKEERGAYREALMMLKNFLKMPSFELEIEYLPTHDFKRSIEDYQHLITPLSDDFDMSGKFDLVTRGEDNSLQVIDFKTSKREEADHFQLRFYKLLAEKKFQKPVRKASFYFLRVGHKKEFDLAKENSAQIEEEILAKINQIKAADSFETKPGKLCKFCLFKAFCPEKTRVGEIIEEVGKEDYANDLPF